MVNIVVLSLLPVVSTYVVFRLSVLGPVSWRSLLFCKRVLRRWHYVIKGCSRVSLLLAHRARLSLKLKALASVVVTCVLIAETRLA